MNVHKRLAFLISFGVVCSAATANGQALSSSVNANDRVAVSTAYEYASVAVSGWADLRVTASAQSPDGRLIPVRVTQEPGLLRVDVPLARGVEAIAKVRIALFVPRRVPRLDLAVPRGNLDVTGLSGHVAMESASGVIRAREIGGATIHTSSGSVTVHDAAGDVFLRTSSANVRLEQVRGTVAGQIGSGNLIAVGVIGNIDVTAASGNVSTNGVSGDVRVVSINGRTELFCVGGRVDVADTSGAVTLDAVGGDVNLETATGRATVITRVQSGARYMLKTLDGRLEFRLPVESSDFSARLSAYLKRIDVGAPFDTAAAADGDGRRLTVRVGNGQTRIDLEAFGGRVALRAGEPRSCNFPEVSR